MKKNSTRRCFFLAMREAVWGNEYSEAIKTDLSPFGLPNSTQQVLIARQATRSQLGLPIEQDNYNNTAQHRFGHCVILKGLSEVDSGPRKVDNVTSVVELKMRTTNCRPFVVGVDGIVESLELESRHGPFAQALMYALDDVLFCRVRCGIKSKVIPLAIIAGENGQGNCLACVLGQLNIPDLAGRRFTYSILDQVPFDLEGNYAERSLAIYLHCANEGVKLANEINSNMQPTSTVLCGGRLQIGRGDVALSDWKLMASPIPHHARVDCKNNISIHQGELFAAYVSLPALQAAIGKDSLWFINYSDMPTEEEAQYVLAKISSVSMHVILVPPHASYAALNTLVKNGSTRDAMSQVLIAAVTTEDQGIIAITKDMSSDANGGYRSLSPSQLVTQNIISKVKLWEVFGQFVTNLLLPMANLSIVHVDIRPGWDETSNILCRADHEELCLIDLESLCKTNTDVTSDKRSFHYMFDRALLNQASQPGLRFLWWQIMTVAHAWLEERDQHLLDTSSFVLYLRGKAPEATQEMYRSFKKLFPSDQWEFFEALASRRNLNDEIDDLKIVSTMEHIASAIQRQKKRTRTIP